jgi:serine/threonine-protein kinase
VGDDEPTEARPVWAEATLASSPEWAEPTAPEARRGRGTYPPESDPRLGTILGGTYRIEAVLGSGGMGTVYRATHLRVPRRFAIKVIRSRVAGDREVLERFRREAEIAGALVHEHLVQVFDFNYTDEGAPYMVMELLEGEDLAARIARRGRLSPEETASLLEQAAGAIEVAHRSDVIHRDLKPQNVFLIQQGGSDQFVKILDFGLSKVLHHVSLVTGSGAMIGTPAYMSPEQATGSASDIDQRTDVFALGTIVYECLSGRRAFDAPMLPGVIHQVCHGVPASLSSLNPRVTEAVARVIARAMAKRREERYPTVASFRDAFLQAVATPSENAPAYAETRSATPTPVCIPLPPPSPTPSLDVMVDQIAGQPTRRRNLVIALASAAVITLGIAGTFVLRAARDQGRRPSDPPEPPPTATAPPAAQPARPGAAAPTDQAAPATRAASPAALASRPSREQAPAVRVRLRLDPSDARVEVDGIPTSENPLRLPRSNRVYQIVVSAPRRLREVRDVRADRDAELAITLQRKERARSRAAAAAPGGPVEDDL